MSLSLLNAIRMIARKKNTDEEKVIKALKFALLIAYRREYGTTQNIEVVLDKTKGNFEIVAKKTVVESNNVQNNQLEIGLDEAKKIDENYQVGDVVEIIITPENFGRIAAQAAKQVTIQKFLDIERENDYNEYIDKKDQIVVGVVKRINENGVIVNLGGLETVLPTREQIPGEIFEVNDKVKLYVSDVKKYSNGVKIFVSRTNPNFVRCLFEREIPEITNGIIEVKRVSREPGKRSKVAVFSQDGSIEAIGACIGECNSRINVILLELGDEKIDLVLWHENKKDYIKSALSPAEIIDVKINESETEALVIVDKEQVSLAIGKNGQNIKLAAKLIGMRLDVKTPEQLENMSDCEGDKI